MARVIINRRNGPFLVRRDEVREDKLWICGCGLTSSPPTCDGSHAAARREPPGALVHYPDNDDGNAPLPVDWALFAPPPPRRPPPRGEDRG